MKSGTRLKPWLTSARYVPSIIEGIEQHLLHEPKMVSKSRIKLLRQPFWSQFRLRLEDFRVYYDVDDEDALVQVLRVLVKTTDPTPEESP